MIFVVYPYYINSYNLQDKTKVNEIELYIANLNIFVLKKRIQRRKERPSFAIISITIHNLYLSIKRILNRHKLFFRKILNARI